MRRILLFCIVLNLFLINSSFANNVVFIDLDFILKSTIIGKSTIKKLEDINNKNLDILKKEQQSLTKERDEIEKTKNIISKDELNKKISILNKKFENFNEKQNLLSKDFKVLRQNEINNVMNKINPIIEKYMIENNIDLILKKENIYISKKEFDISKILIELINNKIFDK